VDVSRAVPCSSAEEFGRWLREHGAAEPERVLATCKKASWGACCAKAA
jgi:hypothetical protein